MASKTCCGVASIRLEWLRRRPAACRCSSPSVPSTEESHRQLGPDEGGNCEHRGHHHHALTWRLAASPDDLANKGRSEDQQSGSREVFDAPADRRAELHGGTGHREQCCGDHCASNRCRCTSGVHSLRRANRRLAHWLTFRIAAVTTQVRTDRPAATAWPHRADRRRRCPARRRTPGRPAHRPDGTRSRTSGTCAHRCRPGSGWRRCRHAH